MKKLLGGMGLYSVYSLLVLCTAKGDGQRTEYVNKDLSLLQNKHKRASLNGLLTRHIYNVSAVLEAAAGRARVLAHCAVWQRPSAPAYS